MIYQWKPQSNIPVPAQLAGETLEEIRTDNGGKLLPADVVAVARDEEHPLHPVFEWSDRKAARLYREEQARHLIRSLVIVDHPALPDAPAIRAFVSVQLPDASERSYTHLSVAMRDPVLAQQVVDRARKELASWKQRYEALRTLSRNMESLFSEIDRFTN